MVNYPFFPQGRWLIALLLCSFPFFSAVAQLPARAYQALPDSLRYRQEYGIDTWDMVLAARYILSLDTLASPYARLAADVGHSSSVSTFDLAQIRHLVLGRKQALKYPVGWYFIPEAFVFSNPYSPWNAIPNDVDTTARFIAVKTGDLDNSVAQAPVPVGVQTFTRINPPSPVQTGDICIIPIVYTGNEALIAYQTGFRFNPSRLEWVGTAAGDLPGYNPDNFGLTRVNEGEIRTLWMADLGEPGQQLEPGTLMFYLIFKSLQTQGNAGSALQIDETVLPCAGWKPAGAMYRILEDNSQQVRARDNTAIPGILRASCYPNPGSDALNIRVESEAAMQGRLALFNAKGVRVYVRDVQLEKGVQEFSIPNVAELPAGVYTWKVYADHKKAQGLWICSQKP